MSPIPVGYAAAHPRLKALDFQPSALLPSEAAAGYLKTRIFTSPQVAPIRAKNLVEISVKSRRIC